jgi:hypothetical protein
MHRVRWEKKWAVALGAVTLGALVSQAWAAPMIYPAKGQSKEQQSKDRYECHGWAVQETGFDPTVPQPAQAQAPPPQGGQVLRGAAGGAAIGAVGGAIAGDAGTGAAIGAASGALIGGMRKRSQERTYQEQQAQAQAAANQRYAEYERALTACMTGRGYSVR